MLLTSFTSSSETLKFACKIAFDMLILINVALQLLAQAIHFGESDPLKICERN